MTNAFITAQSKAATIPLLYTREAKKRVAGEVLQMLLQALDAGGAGGSKQTTRANAPTTN